MSTGRGLYKFSGLDFYQVYYPDSLETRTANVFLKDRFGTIWLGCDDGKVYKITGNSILEVELDNTRSIGQLIEGPDGNIWAIAQGGSLFSISPEISAGSFKEFPINENY